MQDLRQAALHTSHNFLGIVTSEGKYIGLLALEQLPLSIRRILKTDATAADVLAVERVLEIRYLIDTQNPVLSPDDTAEQALLTLQNTPCVAVVDKEQHLRGLLFESSIAGRYKREIANISIRQG